MTATLCSTDKRMIRLVTSAKRLLVATVLLVCLAVIPVHAAPISAGQAFTNVQAWFAGESNPLGTAPGTPHDVNAFPGPNGATAWYVVNLQPQGYVVVAADDAVAPGIIAFSATGFFDPDPKNTQYTLLQNDMPQRIAAANAAATTTVVQKAKTSLLPHKTPTARLNDQIPAPPAEALVSRIRVAPLISSKWDDGGAQGLPCFNYFTPSNYWVGPLALCVAQTVRHFQQEPPGGIGLHIDIVEVNEDPTFWWTRGGDGLGGPYDWSAMSDDPANTSDLTDYQRQQIGSLCSDAGASLGTDYDGARGVTWDSGGLLISALTNTFGYAQGGVWNYYNGEDEHGMMLTNDAIRMINPNLDAGLPVFLSLFNSGSSKAVICDGYGYSLVAGSDVLSNDPEQGGWMFHHLNFCEGGAGDMWYVLPDPSMGTEAFTNIGFIAFNMSPKQTGELISGRITDQHTISGWYAGMPLAGVTVRIVNSGSTFTTNILTNPKGIYSAFVPANDTYTVTPQPLPGQLFSPASATAVVGQSLGGYPGSCGNAWGTNLFFVGTSYEVGGRITQTNSLGVVLGMSNVLVTVGVQTVASDYDGFYVTAMPSGWMGAITPNVQAGSFLPPTTNIATPLSADTTNINFSWQAPTYRNISGIVLRADNPSIAVTNASIAFYTGGITLLGSVMTDSNGNYSALLPIGWSGTAVISQADGGTFYTWNGSTFVLSNQRTYVNLTADAANQYYYWYPPQDITISGYVLSLVTGDPVSNALVFAMAGSATNDIDITGSDGSYSLTVPYMWTGLVVPFDSRGGVFLPSSRQYSSEHSPTTPGQLFFWTPPTPQVTGQIINSDTGAGVDGVIVTLSDGSASATTTVVGGIHGTYQINLPYAGWSGSIIPFYDDVVGGAFMPATLPVPITIFDSVMPTWQWGPPLMIAGAVTRSDIGGVPVANILINAVGTTSASAVTDGTGQYVLLVPKHWSGVVTPSYPPLSGGSFSPVSKTKTNILVNQLNENFSWVPPTLTITGAVVHADNPSLPVAGVSMTFNNAGTQPLLAGAPITILTVADGSYASPALPLGWSGSATLSFPANGSFLPTNVTIFTSIASNLTVNYQWAPLLPTIAGTIFRADNPAIAVTNATVYFYSNLVLAASARTDLSGNYVASVPVGWNGTTTVYDVDGGSFTLASHAYANVTTNMGFQNYFWLPPQNLTISGFVFSRETGLPVIGAKITTSDNRSAITTISGYSITVPYLWSGTITASHPRGGLFLTPTLTIPEVHSSVTGKNFVWTPPTPEITGRIVNVATSSAVTNVVVTLSDGSYTNTTDNNGNYAMILPYYGWSGSLVPTYYGGSFNPASNIVSAVMGDTNLVDWGWLPPESIIGQITRHDTSAPISNVVITATGTNADGSSSSFTAITDGTGNYTIFVPYGWSGTNTPTFSVSGGSFAPSNAVFSNVTTPWSQNYSWLPPSFAIGGFVTRTISGASAPAVGVSVAFSTDGSSDILVGGAASQTLTTDNTGYYSTNVPYGWFGTLTPSARGGSFVPTNIVVAPVTASTTSENFFWLAPKPIYLGQVVLYNGPIVGSGLGVTNVQVIISNDPVSGSFTNLTTDSNGIFQTTLPLPWSGTVTPITPLPGGTFAPPTQAWANVNNDLMDTNLTTFVWTPPPALISITTNPISRGTVTGGGLYPAGSSNTITATPNSVSKFVGWEDGTSNTTRSVVVPLGGTNLTANFADLGPSLVINGPNGTNLIDFGTILLNHAVTTSLIISNIGTSACTVLGIGTPPYYSALPQSFMLNVGASRVVSLTFLPYSAGVWSGLVDAVWVASDYSSAGASSINVRGDGEPPQYALTQTAGNLNFGDVVSGQSATSTLQFRNDGNVPITFTAASWSNGTDFSITGSYLGSLNVGATRSVSVLFSPTQVKVYTNISLRLNFAETANPFVIPATGGAHANVAGTWTSTIHTNPYTLYMWQTGVLVDGLITGSTVMTNDQYVGTINLSVLTGPLVTNAVVLGNMALTNVTTSLTGALTRASDTNLLVTWTRTSTSVPLSVTRPTRPAVLVYLSAANHTPSGLDVTLFGLMPVNQPEGAELLVVEIANGHAIVTSPALAASNTPGMLQTRLTVRGLDVNNNGLPDALEQALDTPPYNGMRLLVIRNRSGSAVADEPLDGTSIIGTAVPLNALPAVWSVTPKAP